MTNGIAYILINKVNQKIYIGQTMRTMHERIKDHRNRKYPIGNAINKYGIESFEIITNDIPEELLDYFESNLIRFLNTRFPNGYNLESGGMANRHLHEITRRKIALSHLGKHPSQATIEKLRLANGGVNHPFYGKKFSDQHRINIGIAGKGRHHSIETKAKMSLSHSNVSQQARNQMSQSHMGIIPNMDTRRKMAEARRKYWARKHSHDGK